MTNVIKFYIFETPSTYLVNKKLPMLAQILKLTTYLPTFAYQQRAQLWHPNCYSLTCLNPTYLLGQQEASNVGSKTFSSPPTYLHTYIPTYLHTYLPTYLPMYINKEHNFGSQIVTLSLLERLCPYFGTYAYPKLQFVNVVYKKCNRFRYLSWYKAP